MHLDSADMELLKRKSDQCKGCQKNALMSKGQSNLYVKLISALEELMREGSGTALTKPLQTQLQADPERRMGASIHRKEFIVPTKPSSLLSPTSSAASPVTCTVPTTTLIDVALSSPVPTLSGRSPQASLNGCPGRLSLQLERA